MMGVRSAGKGIGGFFKKIFAGFKGIFGLLGVLVVGVGALLTGLILGGIAIAM
jgi:hypothetical protein